MSECLWSKANGSSALGDSDTAYSLKYTQMRRVKAHTCFHTPYEPFERHPDPLLRVTGVSGARRPRWCKPVATNATPSTGPSSLCEMTAGEVEEKLKQLGITLPDVAAAGESLSSHSDGCTSSNALTTFSSFFLTFLGCLERVRCLLCCAVSVRQLFLLVCSSSIYCTHGRQAIQFYGEIEMSCSKGGRKRLCTWSRGYGDIRREWYCIS